MWRYTFIKEIIYKIDTFIKFKLYIKIGDNMEHEFHLMIEEMKQMLQVLWAEREEKLKSQEEQKPNKNFN